MKRLLASACAACLFAAPAAAQTSAPTVVRFDARDSPGAYSTSLVPAGPECTGQPFLDNSVPFSAPTFLFAPCRPTLRISFPAPQASVELMARALVAPANELVARALSTTGTAVGETVVADPSSWKPVVLATPDGSASIASVELHAEGANLGVDDLAFSPQPQPDTSVGGGPAARASDGGATFSFSANRPDATGWRCSLDGAALTPCTSPVSYKDLSAGAHTFQVAAIDGYGAVDRSPAMYAWTVLGPLPETQLPAGAKPVVGAGTVTLDLGAGAGAYECSLDAGAFSSCRSPVTFAGLAPGQHTLAVRAVDEDGRADPTPERWTFDVPGTLSAAGNSAFVTDADRDHIPDDQELLPLGNVPPVAGVRGLATLISGTVYVKLPSQAASALAAAPLSGFVPLKGVAALPVGTIVDARRGTLALETAADGRVGTDPRRRLSRSRLSAAIFQIRQARLRRASARARAITTQLVLATPPAADRGCRRNPPAKGIVRSLRADVTGLVRVSGGASFGVAGNAVWRTVDRCRGTTTYVTRGRVRIFDKARRRTITVRAGRRYLAKARLFQARKGLDRRLTALHGEPVVARDG